MAVWMFTCWGPVTQIMMQISLRSARGSEDKLDKIIGDLCLLVPHHNIQVGSGPVHTILFNFIQFVQLLCTKIRHPHLSELPNQTFSLWLVIITCPRHQTFTMLPRSTFLHDVSGPIRTCSPRLQSNLSTRMRVRSRTW